MCDDDINPWGETENSVSRRTFTMTAAAAASLSAVQAHAQANVTERDVQVKTPDGVSDSALYYPNGRGSWPGVVVWPDIKGLRPASRDVGRRLAAQGYVVLVVNPFYRSAKAPAYESLDFNQAAGRTALFGYRDALVAGEGPFRDARAYVAFLDAQPQTNKAKMIGVQGYCMGGPLSFQTAGAVPNRIGAVATFHGGGLTTKDPSSPHLLVAKTKASYLIAVAKNDDAREPESKDILKATFAQTRRPAVVDVYQADHGWTMRDFPVYDNAEAERAFSELTKLYKTALA